MAHQGSSAAKEQRSTVSPEGITATNASMQEQPHEEVEQMVAEPFNAGQKYVEKAKEFAWLQFGKIACEGLVLRTIRGKSLLWLSLVNRTDGAGPGYKEVGINGDNQFAADQQKVNLARNALCLPSSGKTCRAGHGRHYVSYVVDTPEGWDVIQMDLDELEKWALKIIREMVQLSYEERLRKLGLFCLEKSSGLLYWGLSELEGGLHESRETFDWT
ncbi:hypothetical protein BTVI_50409 [Pitangus sulphuratus]|nr:hypothetical protein BTVI_50409 [Pitangus sulphuratus]